MLSRRIKPDGQTVDTRETVLLPNPHLAEQAVRKPSERFMRKPLKAKSKASSSERIKIAGLASGLEKKMRSNVPNDGETKFKEYRPGHDGSPG